MLGQSLTLSKLVKLPIQQVIISEASIQEAAIQEVEIQGEQNISI